MLRSTGAVQNLADFAAGLVNGKRLGIACPNPALVVHRRTVYGSVRSAVELLKQVKALPQRERQKFVLSVLMLEEGAPARLKKLTRRVKWPDVETRARHIFGDRVLPNLVLLEREESAF